MAWRSAVGSLPMLFAGSVMVWPVPLRGQRLAVGRELAANAVGVGNQEGRAEAVAQVAKVVVVHVEHLFGAGQIGRARTSTLPLPGKLAVIWITSMPRPGASVMLVNSGVVVLLAVRVSVTICWPPIDVAVCALLVVISTVPAKLISASARTVDPSSPYSSSQTILIECSIAAHACARPS
jgi:hypothetical protein